MQSEQITIYPEQSLPSQDELDNLGPGCYVQVRSESNAFWVEITEVSGETVAGIIHCELGESRCQPTLHKAGAIQFNKSRIINLGCDNYCWC